MEAFLLGLNWIEALMAAVFAFMTLSVTYNLRWTRRLPSLDSLAKAKDLLPSPVSCSVIIAARDEAARIEQTVRHLLAQSGIKLELIVVDDRSTDSSREVLAQIAQEDARVRVSHVDRLPDGWLGKCHACHTGASAATGDWILFTDADCWLKDDAILRALLVAAEARADHITMTPGVAPGTWPTQAWHLAFLITLADWFAGVNQDKPGRHLGMGAFNLVKAEVYRSCGGYETLKLCVLDDIKLGYLINRIGKRTRAFMGGNDALCHWGGSVRGMIKVMEKNYFAALDYKTSAAMGLGIGGTIFWGLALAGPFTFTLGGLAAGIGVLSLILPAWILAQRLGWGAGGALLTPFLFPFLFYAVLRSAILTLWRGGVRWRDTFYPLERLRQAKLP